MKMQLVTLVFLVAVTLLGCSVAAPPASKGNTPTQTQPDMGQVLDEESQLHQLKGPDVSSVSMETSHSSVYSNVNGHEENKAHSEHQVAQNGEVVNHETADKHTLKNPGEEEQSDVHLVQDYPKENVHHFKDIHNGQVIQENKRDDAHYSPMDLAEYIVRTGDEEGVATAVEELLGERLMTEEQAIRYLEEVKMDINIIKEARQEQMKQEAVLKPITEQLGIQKKTANQDLLGQGNEFTENDYLEMAEKLRTEELRYNEYSLEEIIYQLAHMLFQKSLSKGNAAALDLVQKLSKFIQDEVDQGDISPDVQKRVLDVLMASLADSIEEGHAVEMRKQEDMRPQIKPVPPQGGQQEVTEISPVDIPQANKRSS